MVFHLKYLHRRLFASSSGIDFAEAVFDTGRDLGAEMLPEAYGGEHVVLGLCARDWWCRIVSAHIFDFLSAVVKYLRKIRFTVYMIPAAGEDQ